MFKFKLIPRLLGSFLGVSVLLGSWLVFAQTDLSPHRLLSRTVIQETCDRNRPDCPDVRTVIRVDIKDCTIAGVVYQPQSTDINCPCYYIHAPAISSSAPPWAGCGAGPGSPGTPGVPSTPSTPGTPGAPSTPSTPGYSW